MTKYNGPGEECKREHCKFVHDLDSFLAEKPEDIGPICPIYTTKGFCSRGLTCRFASNHMDENRKNIKQDWYDETKAADSVNQMTTGEMRNISHFFRKFLIISSNIFCNRSSNCFTEESIRFPKIQRYCEKIQRYQNQRANTREKL